MENHAGERPRPAGRTGVARRPYQGSPKGVLLRHRSLVNNALVTGDNMRITEQDRMCVGLPLYH
jgi:hypothetical protein